MRSIRSLAFTAARSAALLLATVMLCRRSSFGADAPATQPTPLVHVHAHNDYLHRRPLLDALDRGFCSVEGDIHLVDGELLIAHDIKKVQPGKTLTSLYLEPLRQRIKANGGRVYRGGPVVVLLIDVKTPFDATYPVLREVLRGYADVLTTWTSGKRTERALLAIITGDRKREVIAADEPRLCACDGDIADLDANPPADLVPWISGDWAKNFTWRADGVTPMSEAERSKLRAIAARVHEQGRTLRWWGSPDNALFWAEIRADGVDWINTDDLPGAQKFVLSK
jgi:hypothetical protein